MDKYVLDFQNIDRTKLSAVGGKAASLAELSRVKGIRVPDGFCVTTEAYKKAIKNNRKLESLLDGLTRLKPEDRKNISQISAKIRAAIGTIPIPVDMAEEISCHLAKLGEKHAFAVRSSATLEDLPSASFAGQHDTYLNITGKESVLEHISKCWASLFTDRAIIYRMQNSFARSNVLLSVVVQNMVFPQASGILFTADPVTSNRKVLSINAGFGLGEAIVSGLVSADCYRVQEGKITGEMIAAKKLAVYALAQGGTQERRVAPGKQKARALTRQQVLQLARTGRQIESYFGGPQDIEWCLADGIFYIVQSRPVTTLYPVPEANDRENHVYISVGYQQMMTDAIKPLGLSFFQLTAFRPMFRAGGRLFVDVARELASPVAKKAVIAAMGQSAPLIKDALMAVVKRKNFIRPSPGAKKTPTRSSPKKTMSWDYLAQFRNNPAIVPDLIKSSRASIEELKQNIQTKSGTDLFDFILEDIPRLKNILFNPRSSEVINVAMYASSWVNKKMMQWLDEKNAADTLSKSVAGNITSEMGLALLDAADVIRPYPEVINYLQHVKGDDFLDGLTGLDGGKQALEAIHDYLGKYGMRCAGEIDITKTRWSENPSALVPVILNNIKNFGPNAGKQKFGQGRQQAQEKEQELLARLRKLPGGERRAKEAELMISIIRNFSGYREYPKYGMVSRYFLYRQALLKEAGQLVSSGVIREKEDIYYLTFEEFREAVRANRLDYSIISRRKDEYKLYEKLTPPRVITSDGEIFSGGYRRKNLPAGAIAGLTVSSGLAEGRARVIINMEDAGIEAGDILVTPFTDPSWTPLFVSIKGLVTEVGGLMTHGAVIAREYGLPAVVGVENATKLIKDGQRIRVNGTDGYVEIL